MGNTRSRRDPRYAADMAVYNLQMSTDNAQEQSLLKKNLALALQQDVTPRQRDMLYLYYNEKLTMKEIAHRLGVDKSTVSRTIKRGETKLQRCLRYGAASLLRASTFEEES